MKLLRFLSLRYCNLVVVAMGTDTQNPHVLCNLFTAESLPAVRRVNISGNQKGDVSVRTKLLEAATFFVQSRGVEIEMRDMDIFAVLTDAITCKLYL